MRSALVLAVILSTFCWVREYPFPPEISFALVVLFTLDVAEVANKLRRQ